MSSRKLQPSGDHILIQFAQAVQAVARENESRRLRTAPSPAKVIAVGPGKESANGNVIPLGLKVGERILVERGRGIKIRLHRQNYAVIRKQDLVEARA
jgi:chaperonin GroES